MRPQSLLAVLLLFVGPIVAALVTQPDDLAAFWKEVDELEQKSANNPARLKRLRQIKQGLEQESDVSSRY